MKLENMLFLGIILAAIAAIFFAKIKICADPQGNTSQRPWLWPCPSGSKTLISTNVYTGSTSDLQS